MATRARRTAKSSGFQTIPTQSSRLLLLFLSLVSRVSTQPAVPGEAFLFPGLSGTSVVPAEEAIVVANRGLRVPFGREVWLDPVRDLVLQVQPGDRCSVTVLDNDALAQRPGRLSPKRFACDYGPGEVRYLHLGARSPSRDRVRLQLRYDAPGGAIVLPLALEVEVVFTQLEVVTRNLPLVVEELLGTSNALDSRSLEFAYQSETEECRVGILSGLSALPRYGELLHYPQVPGGTSETLLMDCKAFLELGVRYRHTAPSRSPNRDWLPMVVELHSRGAPMGSPPLKREHFQVLVRIRGGAENTAPKPSFVAMMMMEVDQFVLTALTPDMLAAEDAESNPDLLIFNLTSAFQPGQGYLVSTDDRSLPLSSFTQRDLRLLKIAYQPPSEDSNEERLFELELEVVDPEGAASDPFAFMVVVKPMNTLAPVVTRNTGLILYEGQYRPLTGPVGSGPQNLVISDEDDLEAVRLEVVAGLRHGHLVVLGSPSSDSAPKTFTVAELAAGQVVYQHDDRDGSLSDNLVLRMSDGEGRHQVQFLFPITLVPLDDQPPVLNANTGLTMAEGETVPVPPTTLSATDMDSDDSQLRFVLESPFSTTGYLLLRQTHAPQEEQGLWQKRGLFYERRVTEWRQQDITEGRLFYRHSGPHSPGPVMDQLTFRVQDNHDPPNQSGIQKFVIRIHPVDRLPPELGRGCPLRMVKKWLHYTDVDTDDRELHYTVTQPPMDTDENHAPAPLGTLVFTDNPSIIVTHFTQAQVNHHKIAYRPPNQELGVAARVAQFQFQVEDRAGNVAPGTFTLYLQPVDNQPPEIVNTGFTIEEKGHHILQETELHVNDVDTDVAHISFTLTQAPKHGHMQISGQTLHVGGHFRLEDIQHGRVSYSNSGDESLTDSCSLEVSDRHHVVPITLRVNIKPVDREGPRSILPAGTLESYLDVLENGATEVTANIIKGTYQDTDDLMLTFLLENPPLYGEILVNGAPAEHFTQRDILEGSVVYVHTSGEIGLLPKADSFNLSLSDMSQEWRIGSSIIQGVTVWVTILPVDSQAPEISVGEQFVVLEGDKSMITLTHLSAEDTDSLNDDLLCTIVIQPTSGYVENISPAPGSEKSRAGIAISAFTVKDLRQGHINYVQSVHRGVEPVEDRFIFRCSDGINFSERQIFPIVIIPTNDEQPEMFMREFMVMEGMSLVVDTPILNAADADIPRDDLTFTITRFPTHGHIMNQLINGTVLVESFTLDQIIESSSIIYEHDDSETQEDSFVIKLTDGKHSVEKMALIVVIPVDDETPRMTINNGLEIEVGETKVINNKILMATDLDSDDKSLVYIIRYGPGHGLLQRQKPTGVFENITLGMNFTQDEVDRNLIQYVHFGQEGIRDLIKFDVTDGTNALIDRYFYVSIGSVDIVFPDVISKGVSLREGGKVTLTTDLLSTSDLNSPDENLVFTITRAPMRGHLECTDQRGVSITSFTQLQLAGNKIYYIHTAEDEMERNPVFRTFRISISDVDNKKPVVTIHNLVVSESESKLITPFELTVEDRDTPDRLLKFTVTQVPVHGHLLFNNTRSVMVFTKQDLNENLISYKHDGTESTEDSFSFTVTDGTHSDFYVFPDTVFETRRPQVMKIQVLAVDNSVPQIVVNKGASTLRTLATGHLGFMITSKVLKVEDRDSLHFSLRFIVTEAPQHGYLLNLGQGNHSITQFTQADIDDLKICYVLRERANATSDMFHFIVEDDALLILFIYLFWLLFDYIATRNPYREGVRKGGRERERERNHCVNRVPLPSYLDYSGSRTMLESSHALIIAHTSPSGSSPNSISLGTLVANQKQERERKSGGGGRERAREDGLYDCESGKEIIPGIPLEPAEAYKVLAIVIFYFIQRGYTTFKSSSKCEQHPVSHIWAAVRHHCIRLSTLMSKPLSRQIEVERKPGFVCQTVKTLGFPTVPDMQKKAETHWPQFCILSFQGGHLWCMPLPGLQSGCQVSLGYQEKPCLKTRIKIYLAVYCDVKASFNSFWYIVYTIPNLKFKETWAVVSHTFNPSIWEAEAGRSLTTKTKHTLKRNMFLFNIFYITEFLKPDQNFWQILFCFDNPNIILICDGYYSVSGPQPDHFLLLLLSLILWDGRIRGRVGSQSLNYKMEKQSKKTKCDRGERSEFLWLILFAIKSHYLFVCSITQQFSSQRKEGVGCEHNSGFHSPWRGTVLNLGSHNLCSHNSPFVQKWPQTEAIAFNLFSNLNFGVKAFFFFFFFFFLLLFYMSIPVPSPSLPPSPQALPPSFPPFYPLYPLPCTLNTLPSQPPTTIQYLSLHGGYVCKVLLCTRDTSWLHSVSMYFYRMVLSSPSASGFYLSTEAEIVSWEQSCSSFDLSLCSTLSSNQYWLPLLCSLSLSLSLSLFPIFHS
ncbi:Frem2 [Phodopus roborovskii]|uniref:Frem2 protein n=1 Tax=Phodopus roborovskii TaxID=109678 RepID=A0AAU9YV07_PHORO|nr:Frem2 [Phodopus roborovskii]